MLIALLNIEQVGIFQVIRFAGRVADACRQSVVVEPLSGGVSGSEKKERRALAARRSGSGSRCLWAPAA